LILMGSFSSNTFVASTTASCIFLAAFYSLWLATRLLFGAPSNYIQSFNDIELRELISQLCLIIPVYLFGLYPQPLCSIILPTLNYCFIHWAIVSLDFYFVMLAWSESIK
jgi:NADH-quinone oxidoreductase subunit M